MDQGLDLAGKGFVTTWIGQRGLTMHGLDALLDSRAHVTPKPSAIFIHCGSNDLTAEGVTGKNLAEQMKTSILRYQALFGGALIIWSGMLQRRYWHFAPLLLCIMGENSF